MSAAASGDHGARHHGRGAEADHAESVALTRQVVRRVNGLPVVVGASSPGFASMGALVKDVMDAGAGGVMIAPPATQDRRPDRRLLRQRRRGDRRRRAVRDPGLSVCVRRVHGAVGDRRIVAAHPSCKMVKHEEWPGLEKLTALKNLMADGGMRKVAILCGNGGIASRMSWSAAPTAPTPAMSRNAGAAGQADQGRRTRGAHACSTGICRCCATSSGPACSGSRCANTSSSAAADRLRRAAQARHQAVEEAIAEIEFLIARLERNN